VDKTGDDDVDIMIRQNGKLEVAYHPQDAAARRRHQSSGSIQLGTFHLEPRPRDPRGSSSTMRPGSPHDGSISIGVTLKTFTPLSDRFGNRRERGGGLFNRLTVVVDDAPPPVWVAGSRDSKHVHLDDLDAQDNSSA
jgi:hypothetical protein